MKEKRTQETNIKKLTATTNPHYEAICASAITGNMEVIEATVHPWAFGAKVIFFRDGKSTEEHFCIPPPVGRFDIDTYNAIVRQINASTGQLQKQKPPS